MVTNPSGCYLEVASVVIVSGLNRYFARRYLGKGVLKAVENINAILAPALKVSRASCFFLGASPKSLNFSSVRA